VRLAKSDDHGGEVGRRRCARSRLAHGPRGSEGHDRPAVEAFRTEEVAVRTGPDPPTEARDQLLVVDLKGCRRLSVLLGNHVLELVPADEVRPGKADNPDDGIGVDEGGLPPQIRERPEKYSWWAIFRATASTGGESSRAPLYVRLAPLGRPPAM
jgi:hypothetical protein